MADIRRINFHRKRVWGDQHLKLARITGDDSYQQVQEIAEDFLVRETKDEADSEQRFEFRLYGCPDQIDLSTFNLVLFAGRRFEVMTKELRKQRRPYVELLTKPIGAI